MPPKAFRGPIGALESWDYKFDQLDMRKDTIKTTLVAARERHNFCGQHELFACPALECGAWFDQPEQFTTYMLIEDDVDLSGSHREAAEQLMILEPSKDLFAEYNQELDELEREVQKRRDCFSDLWDGRDMERNTAMQVTLHQIEHDPLYLQGRPAMHSRRLRAIIEYIGDYD